MNSDSADLCQRLDILSRRIDKARDQFDRDGASPVLVEERLGFVRELIEDVTALASTIVSSASPSGLTLGRFKDLLASDRHRIRLHDALVGEVQALRGRLIEEHFPALNIRNLSVEDYLARVDRYETLAGPLMAIMAAGGYWGREEQVRLLGRCLARLADPPGERNGVVALLNLRLYPALLLTYACGIGAVLAGRYSTLATMLVSTRTWKDNKQEPLVLSHGIQGRDRRRHPPAPTRTGAAQDASE